MSGRRHTAHVLHHVRTHARSSRTCTASRRARAPASKHAHVFGCHTLVPHVHARTHTHTPKHPLPPPRTWRARVNNTAPRLSYKSLHTSSSRTHHYLPQASADAAADGLSSSWPASPGRRYTVVDSTYALSQWQSPSRPAPPAPVDNNKKRRSDTGQCPCQSQRNTEQHARIKPTT